MSFKQGGTVYVVVNDAMFKAEVVTVDSVLVHIHRSAASFVAGINPLARPSQSVFRHDEVYPDFAAAKTILARRLADHYAFYRKEADEAKAAYEALERMK